MLKLYEALDEHEDVQSRSSRTSRSPTRTCWRPRRSGDAMSRAGPARRLGPPPSVARPALPAVSLGAAGVECGSWESIPAPTPRATAWFSSRAARCAGSAAARSARAATSLAERLAICSASSSARSRISRPTPRRSSRCSARRTRARRWCSATRAAWRSRPAGWRGAADRRVHAVAGEGRGHRLRRAPRSCRCSSMVQRLLGLAARRRATRPTRSRSRSATAACGGRSCAAARAGRARSPPDPRAAGRGRAA